MTADDPLGHRHSPDKLAILCAERALLFVAVRSLAIFTLLLGLIFVADGLTRLTAWIAHSSVASFFFIDETMSEQDRTDLASLADGFPYDVARLALLLTGLSALVVTQLLATRGLPPGVSAMESAIVNGLPWPGRWQSMAASARAVRPWAITAAGFGVTAWVMQQSWPLTGEDWSYLPMMLLLIEIGVWVAAYLSWKGAGQLTNLLPSYADVSNERLEEARREVEEADEAEAVRRWPHKRELRLSAAVTVFAAPPPPLRRRKERKREAWWAGTTTSVESLATELVLQALVQAREMGLVTITQPGRRNPGVVATLPPEEQPHGLARLVAGFHREGLTPGHVVSHKLSDMLHEAYGVDQYAIVIGIALEDLAAAGVASQSPDGWQLSAELLNAVASQLATVSETTEPATTVTAEHDLAVLRRHVFGRLRHKRTTEAEGEGIKSLLFAIYQMSAERRERSSYQLPTPAEEG